LNYQTFIFWNNFFYWNRKSK